MKTFKILPSDEFYKSLLDRSSRFPVLNEYIIKAIDFIAAPDTLKMLSRRIGIEVPGEYRNIDISEWVFYTLGELLTYSERNTDVDLDHKIIMEKEEYDSLDLPDGYYDSRLYMVVHPIII